MAILKTITEEVSEIVNQVEEKELSQVAERIDRSGRVFIAGNGRSGLAGKMFAMRLMHLGYNAYVVGETITPGITENDLLLVISGSGNNKTLTHYATKATEVNADIALISTRTTSSVGEYAKQTLVIPAETKNDQGERRTIQPLGSPFDQAAHLVLDSIIVHLMQSFMSQEQRQGLHGKHANLE
ncbi:6-phospho-3-hexuloisomerase [Halalkalibacillus halophilus]|uniref:6-phospho-3-hexuloisomerase n=1 Tax=Halalkalibacillus halophilus TaxID=392827 RepID=UPI000429F365|nr:6-phospho-3-hexuloisomerase [Halalkalibacillus halophilus]